MFGFYHRIRGGTTKQSRKTRQYWIASQAMTIHTDRHCEEERRSNPEKPDNTGLLRRLAMTIHVAVIARRNDEAIQKNSASLQ